MAPETKHQQEQQQKGVAPQSLIRKLTTEKAVKVHRQQTKETATTADEITNIKLSGRGVKTIESLDLPSLRRLDLSKNNLNRLKGLQGCPQVTYLTAAGNELTGEGLDGVRPLRDLKVFNASGNRVKRIPPTVFAQFRQLQALVLNNNEISEVPPTWLKKGVLTLNTLVLSHNKVKSLADAGLGRLTALTKLSVSYNMLSELPDLSACSALEELRAAHNVISQVHPKLGKNVALRTLDLGHNNIDEWGGLERVGKTLTSLVQLTLAGNPLCGSGPSGTAEVSGATPEEEEGSGEAEGGEYTAKVRSLFPSLKVRDGKRVLMKKSHTYYEQRAAAAGGETASGAPAASAGRSGEKTGDDRGSRKRVRDPEAKHSKRTGGGEEREGKSRKPDLGDAKGEEGDGSKTRRVPKTNTARAAGKNMGATEDELGVGAEVGVEEPAGSVAPRRGGPSDRKPQPPAEEVSAALKPKKKKKRRLEGEDPATEKCDKAPKDKKSHRLSETVAVEATSGTTKEGKKQQGKKKRDTKVSAKNPASSGSRASRAGGNGGGGGIEEKDPYSSSEELPAPGTQARSGAGGVATGGAGGGAKSATPQEDRESGVVGIVLNNRKRKGGKGPSKGKSPRQAGAALEGDGPGEGGDERGFSIGAMLEARGQRETVGLGAGVSAWD